jgi:hypothetical protein
MDVMLEKLLEKSEALLLRLVGQPETISLIEAKCSLREVIQEIREACKERETATCGTQSLAAAFSQQISVEDEPEPVARFRSDQEFIDTFKSGGLNG